MNAEKRSRALQEISSPGLVDKEPKGTRLMYLPRRQKKIKGAATRGTWYQVLQSANEKVPKWRDHDRPSQLSLKVSLKISEVIAGKLLR